ncbi:transposase [Streptomyces sp. NPDC050509]|uniref:transposase n=1 Tax=Streptomyces sp. NPDC050509 TaxID=3365620 RepID=UPI003798A946
MLPGGHEAREFASGGPCGVVPGWRSGDAVPTGDRARTRRPRAYPGQDRAHGRPEIVLTADHVMRAHFGCGASMSCRMPSGLCCHGGAESGNPGLPRADDRVVLNGTVRKLRTGSARRDVPERYGSWQTLYTRSCRWALGRYLLPHAEGDPDGDGRGR